MIPERSHPLDPIAAVTHPDPYPFYAELAATRPLYRDEALGVWVAAGAAAVAAVLASDLCRVRPPAEPVPGALLGSPAGEVFGQLARMSDGPGHAPRRQAAVALLEKLAEPAVAAAGRHWACHLAGEVAGGDLGDFHFRLPVYVVASLLGIPPDELPRVAAWAGDFAAALAPGSAPGQVEQGKAAAGFLLERFRALGLGEEGLDKEIIVANAIGLLFQAHDATAGLIGNTLVALGRHPEVRARVAADPDLLPAVLREVLRYDPPVQNTRRFVARDGIVAGQEMREGDAVLVLLAAANRDPAVQPHSECFDPFRPEPRSFTFGAGAHACPGQALALAIACAGVERLILTGLDLQRFAATVTYRPSANVRVPERTV